MMKRTPAHALFGATVMLAATAAAPPDQTAPSMPPMAVGNEANAEQLKLARREGAAYDALVRWERQGASWSKDGHAGDFRLVAALSPAEGSWSEASGAPAWTDAPQGMAHLRVFPEDGASLRFVPGLVMRAQMLDGSGGVLGETPLIAGLYPVTDAYGANVALPPGVARIAIVIEPLQAKRHDPYNGDRFFKQTTALFDAPARLDTGGQTASERAEASPPTQLKAERVAALKATLQNMWDQASDGGEKTDNGMIVDYAMEYSESFWQFDKNSGQYRYSIENDSSEKTNDHIEVAPRDPRTGSFLGGATVHTVLSRAAKNYRQEYDVPLLWHSWLYHYGGNVRVPGTGRDYTFEVHVTPPTVPHYGRQTGNQLFTPAAVTFENVQFWVGSR